MAGSCPGRKRGNVRSCRSSKKISIVHIDARNIADNSIIEGDVCIIGTGAAGMSIALEWINTHHQVILLEGGGFDYDQRIQDLYAGTESGQKYFPLEACRLHYFGGTTGHWAGYCATFDPIDFVKRDWVPDSGWPITREELDPFYARANEKLQLGPYNYDLAFWQQQLPNLNPLPLDPSVMWNKMWQFSQARFGTLYRDRILKAGNIHLYTYANVVNIVTNDAVSSVKEVTVKNYAGKTHTVRARHFILACGAIQNARMLLASNSQAPNGLGNDHDLVGRYFMEHIEIGAAELWLLKPFPTDLYKIEFGVTRARAELSLTARMQTEHRILNSTAALEPLAAALLSDPPMVTYQDSDPRKAFQNMLNSWDAADKKAAGQNSGSISRAFQMHTRIEQAPNPNSRITLASEKDELGVPRAHLNWQLTALEKRSIRTFYELLGQQVGAAGIGRVRLNEFLRDENDSSWPVGTNGGWHHMGTTRMSSDPKNGVVDPNCRVHGISNLHVAGSGCYVTSAAPNPTLTLVALSLRLSDHLKQQMAKA